MTTGGQRYLMIYSGVLTAVFAVTVLSGFAHTGRTLTLDRLDVQRIDLREPDGTLRLAITSADRSPGIIIKGKEYPHPDRKSAGMLFYNAEGTENGGLIFGGEKTADGRKTSHGHLSFDAYEQDQTMALDSHQDGAARSTKLQFTDYPDGSIVEAIRFLDTVKHLPQDQKQARIDAFVAAHGGPVPRMVLERGVDDGVRLALNDAKGRPRIVMQVAPDGTPSLRTLDAAGKVTGEMAHGP